MSGVATVDGFIVEHRFPDSTFINRFVRVGENWHWTIIERTEDRPEKLFAKYNELSRLESEF